MLVIRTKYSNSLETCLAPLKYMCLAENITSNSRCRMLSITEEEMKCFMRLLSKYQETTKEKTYERTYQFANTVKEK